VIAAQLRAAQAAGDMPARLDPDLEAITLLTMSAGLGTSVIVGHSSAGQAQAVIDYHLRRLFPGYPALRAPMKAPAIDTEVPSQLRCVGDGDQWGGDAGPVPGGPVPGGGSRASSLPGMPYPSAWPGVSGQPW
jgi:BetI-type transcriptional repressor, C-terminal